MDYIDKLSEEEKAFLNNFVEEYHIANFNHKGKKFYKSKREKREIYGNNNASNRCITSLQGSKTMKASSEALKYIEMLTERYLSKNEIEDSLIELIDLKNAAKEEEN